MATGAWLTMLRSCSRSPSRATCAIRCASSSCPSRSCRDAASRSFSSCDRASSRVRAWTCRRRTRFHTTAAPTTSVAPSAMPSGRRKSLTGAGRPGPAAGPPSRAPAVLAGVPGDGVIDAGLAAAVGARHDDGERVAEPLERRGLDDADLAQAAGPGRADGGGGEGVGSARGRPPSRGASIRAARRAAASRPGSRPRAGCAGTRRRRAARSANARRTGRCCPRAAPPPPAVRLRHLQGDHLDRRRPARARAPPPRGTGRTRVRAPASARRIAGHVVDACRRRRECRGAASSSCDEQLAHLRRGVDHDHAVGRRRGQPALDGGADLQPPRTPCRKAACRASRIISSRPLRLRQRRGARPPHEHARSALQLDVARLLEVLVGGGDGVVVDLEPARQRAHAGQPLAMGEGAVQDLAARAGSRAGRGWGRRRAD